MTKPVQTGFVSHAHNDSALVHRFVEIMQPRCATLRDVEIRLWSDGAIRAGERWQTEIETALADADFGLVCISPSLLASSFITRVELPELLDDKRVAIPLALEPLGFDGMDLKELDSLQIFHLRRPGESHRRSFDECRGVNAKRFCNELASEIVQRLRAAGRLA